MANTLQRVGLIPVQHLNGSPWNGEVETYRIPAADTNAYRVGDAVTVSGGGSLKTRIPDCILFGSRNAASVAGNILGVITGIGTAAGDANGEPALLQADADDLGLDGIPATKSKDYYVSVCVAPDTLYKVQADTLAVADMNANCPLFVATNPSDPAKFSASYAQASAADVTAAFPLKIVRPLPDPQNDLTAPGTNAWLLVKINNSVFSDGAVGV